MARVDINKIAESLQQNESARQRHDHIHLFGKALRRGDQFQLAWDAVGGTIGLVSLMATFSVKDVRFMCFSLGRTSSAQKARSERRAALSELYWELCRNPRDDRPLWKYYQSIVPACNLDVVKAYEEKRGIEWTTAQQKRLFLGHTEEYEKRFLKDIFSPDSKDSNFASETRLFCGNLEFCETILTTLYSKDNDSSKTQIPRDFFDVLAMPLLRRLLKSRYDDDIGNKFLKLVVSCIRKHQDTLAKRLHFGKSGIIQYTMDRWHAAPTDSESKAERERLLTQLIALVATEDQPHNLDRLLHATTFSRGADKKARYDFFRLILLHLKGYEFDLEDDSKHGITQVKNLPVQNDRWPARLFFSFELVKTMRLFEKLENLHPRGDFLAPAMGCDGKTVLKQSRSPEESSTGDVQIVKALLLRNSGEQVNSSKLEWIHPALRERRAKAEQSREAADRSFWAQSALCLSVAAGDLPTFRDTILWARRFNKDWLTTRELYSSKVFEARELEDLLGAMPECEDTNRARLAGEVALGPISKDVEVANQVFLDLLETATMAIEELGFQRAKWTSVLRIGTVLVNKRFEFFKDLIGPTREHADRQAKLLETVWKPTTNTLVEAEALLRKPASQKLLNGRNEVDAPGIHVFWKLSRKNMLPTLQADLARFLIDRTRALLGSEGIRMKVSELISVVDSLSRCDQPALACPFICELIMDGDGHGSVSSWHRQLLAPRFLSELPAATVKDLLHGLADAMTGKLREQNIKWDNRDRQAVTRIEQETDAASTTQKSQQPAIKVSTVKMMAQLLRDNRFLSASDSCSILIGLLSEARHVDILITITNSLISTMEERSCPEQLRILILNAIEKYIVPVTAQLDERRRLSEEDWVAAAGETGTLPSIGEDAALLGLLIERTEKAKLGVAEKARLAGFIVKAFEQSSINNNRWLMFFLQKNNFHLDAQAFDAQLLYSPVHLDKLTSFFQSLMPYMPASLLEKLRLIIIGNIDPSPEMASITKLVKEDRDLVNSNAGKHWLSQFDNPGIDTFGLGLVCAALALQEPIKTKLDAENAINANHLQRVVLAGAERLLMSGQTSVLDTLVWDLCERRFNSRQQWESWLSNCVPVVEAITNMIDDIRASSSTNKGIKAAVLPKTFRLQVKMLPIPYSSFKEPASEQLIQAFVKRLSELVDVLANRRLPYHEDLVYVKEELKRAPRAADYISFALQLHKLSSMEEPSLADYLRLELAGEFLVKAEDPRTRGVIEDARAMIEAWKTCHDEELRTMGLNVAEKLRAKGKKGWM